MNLLDRIDLALQHARKSRGELAEALDVSVQAISNLKRRPGSTLRPEKVAKAARWLHCDVYWLCTGEPNHYVPERSEALYSQLAQEVAKWLDSMNEEERNRAFVLIYQMRSGKWPVLVEPEPQHQRARR